MLTTEDLIARMTPMALAETITSLEQAGNLDAVDAETIDLLRDVLDANVGPDVAAQLIDAVA